MTDRLFDAHTRQARAIRIVDGDTLDLEIDLGFRVSLNERVRLLGVDTPELRSSDPEERLRAKEAKELVAIWCMHSADGKKASDWPLVVRSRKTGKYGRWLARIWRISDGQELGRYLLDEGLGELYLR